MSRRAVLVLTALLLLEGVAANPNERTTATTVTAAQPIFVLLSSTIDDPLQIDISEERLRRTLPMLERYRAQAPAARVSALYQFSGTVAEAFAERNGGDRVLDSILQAARAGLIEIGYDGTEEPTFVVRPRPNLRKAKTGEQRWDARREAAEWFLTEHKDRLTGEPDPDRSGGLKKVREVFGDVRSIAGVSLELGGDSEIVHLVRQQTFDGIMPGLPEATAYPARLLPGYAGTTNVLGATMSPDERSAPELFWQDNVLRLSDTSGEPVKVVSACDGPEPLAKLLAALDRSRPHVVRVRLGNPSMYLRSGYAGGRYVSPLQAAYDNPKGARLPQDGWAARADVEAAFAREDDVVKWLVESFFPSNPGSRFVSVAELRRMAGSSVGSRVSRRTLGAATSDLLARWERAGGSPPDFAFGGGEYFSLADMFQMLSTALAGFSTSGAMPESIRLAHVYGPLELTEEEGPGTGDFTVAEVAHVAASLESRLNCDAWTPLPANVIPAWVTVEDVRVNAAQFLRLMAEALVAARADARVRLRSSYMFSGVGEAFPKSRLRRDTGAVWTLKPAMLSGGETAAR